MGNTTTNYTADKAHLGENELHRIETICGVECYEKDGTAYLKLETVARGLGFTEIAKSGNECIRWRTVRKYLQDLSVATSCDDDELPDFIPENIFYRLAMKAKNETAEKFQTLVADEIIPSIRKHGAYATDDVIENILNNPDFGIQLLEKLKEERERSKKLETEKKSLELETIEMAKTISELEPKANYVDVILQSKATVCTTQIAQDYGMSAKAFNKKLKELGVQRKVNGQWILYSQYQGKGYVHSNTVNITRSNGQPDVVMNTEWCQKGRLFLYELLKNNGIYPLIEQAA